MSSPTARTFVLAHGSWHGGWCWAPVAARLRAHGHRVFTPSFTGMGERAQLLSPSITIDTFIDDLIQVITGEDLHDVVLVGHSFAGVPITGVADRLPERLAGLVYFDSVVLESGRDSFSHYPPQEARARVEAAQRATGGLAVPVPDPLPAAWGLEPGSPEHEWVVAHLTPHPLGSYTTPLNPQHPIGNGLPCTYIHCTAPSLPLLESSRVLVRALGGWNWVELAAPHEAHITHPDMLADVLLNL